MFIDFDIVFELFYGASKTIKKKLPKNCLHTIFSTALFAMLTGDKRIANQINCSVQYSHKMV